MSVQTVSAMQLLLCTSFALGCAASRVAAGSEKGIDEMAVLSKLGGGQFEMIKGLLAKQKAGVPIPGLVRKNRDVQDDPAISILSRGASRSFATATEDSESSRYGGSEGYSSSESYSSEGTGRSSGSKNWLNWRPSSDDLAPAPAAVQNANWKPPTESKDEKAVSGLLGMVAGLTGKTVQTQPESQEVPADQQQPAFANDLNGLGVTSTDPNELRLEAHSMSWDSIVPVTPIFKSEQAKPEVNLAAAANPRVGKWLGWKPHNDDDEAAAALGDVQQSAPPPAPSPEAQAEAKKSQAYLLSTSQAVMEANAASTKLGSDLESFDYDTSDSHQKSNAYVESLGTTYKMFAGAIPAPQEPQSPPAPVDSAAQPDVKLMVEQAAGDAPSSATDTPQSPPAAASNGVNELSALSSSMNSAQLNTIKSLLAKQQAGLAIPGLTTRKHADLKALFTGSSLGSMMDTLSTGSSSSESAISETTSDASESSRYGGSYGGGLSSYSPVGAGAIFEGRKNWLSWRPHDDAALDGQQMKYRPKNTKSKDENAVNGLLETVHDLTGKSVQREQADQQQQQEQPSFVHDLDAAESWALRDDAKKMTWESGEIMQPETAPISSALQAPPAQATQAQPVVDGNFDANELEDRQKARTESWGQLFGKVNPMRQSNRPTMSALQQDSLPPIVEQSPAAMDSYAGYMSDLGVSSSQPEPSALQVQSPSTGPTQEKSIEAAYMNDLDAPIDASTTSLHQVLDAPPSNSYMSDLS